METKTVLRSLKNIWLFSILDEDVLKQLRQSATLVSLNTGEMVFSEGEPGDEFYIIYMGKIRLVKTEGDREINLGIKTKGDHFGETALIKDAVRNAGARAAEDTVLISFNRAAFDKHIFFKPEIRDYFDKFIKYASIQRFLKVYTRLSKLPPKDLQELVKNFQSESFNEGDVVFRQGMDADKFYLLEKGKMKIVKWEKDDQTILNFLHDGDFFGEKALVQEKKRSADAVCLSSCHLFSVTKEVFLKLVSASPKMKQILEDRIHSYLASSSISYQEVIKQEMASEKTVEVVDGSKEDFKPSPKYKTPSGKLLKLYHHHVHFPFVSQPDEMSCGTTCLKMLLKYYGKHFSNNRLRDLAHVDLSGSSLANLAGAAEELGFSTRGMKLDYDTLISVTLPCIVHWQGFHYILVYKIDNNQVWVADPALGLRKYKRDFFIKNWSGIALIIEPTPAFEQAKEDVTSLKNFLPFIRPHYRILVEIFIASLLLNAFGLATPIFTQNIIDKVLYHGNTSMLNVMMGGMIMVLFFRVIVGILRQYLIVHTSMKIDLTMLIAFYKHLLSLPLGYFKKRKIGDFITRFGENQQIRNFITNTALSLVLDAISIVVYLLLMFYYNAQLTLLVLLFIPVFIAVTLIFTPMLKRLNVESFAAGAESESLLIESISGIDTVKALNIEQTKRWQWENKFIKSLNIDFRLFKTSLYFSSIGDFLGSLSSTVILWYGAHKVMAGALSVGELMAFMALMGSVISPIDRVIKVWDSVQQTLVSIDRLNDVFLAPPESTMDGEDKGGVVLRKPKGDIRFQDVFFRYGSKEDPYILSNLNLRIRPGQKVAIVGRSGSGKSTMVKLIARFFDTTEGSISIDGNDIRSLRLSDLRRHIGFVLQENFMFNGTIQRNISIGDKDKNMEKVITAAKLASAHEFISKLPLGYDTKIGESGVQLSGGQKQRVAIARILYRNPGIIIFDEATSSLDHESEQAIQKNMETILKDKTAIIIAHRLSTVKTADWIFVLDNGEIVESGTHDRLMAQRGLYHYLNHQQLDL